MFALDTILNFYMSMQMYIVGGTSLSVSKDIGDAVRDHEGVQSMAMLGKNMSLLLEMMEHYRHSQS